jgi:hypothetical protein
LRIPVVIALAGCRDEPPDEQKAPERRTLAAEGLGVEITLPMGWLEEPGDPPARSSDRAPTVVDDADRARIVARARRVPGGRPFLVAPKVAITVEPTAKRVPEDVFRSTLDDLKRIDDDPSVDLVRSSMSTRFAGTDPVGDIELAYDVEVGGERASVLHRSLVVLRRPPEGARAIVTITATHLAKDADIVASEVSAILNSLTLEVLERAPQ